MRQFLVFSIVLLALSGFVSFPTYSQTVPQQNVAEQPIEQAAPVQPSIATVQTPPTTELAPEAKTVAVPNSKKNDLSFDETKYIDPSYPNLARLYWALGVLDINNDKQIDHFIAITECEMYKTYFKNDLEWVDLREATRAHLKNNYKNFSTSFKFTIPLYLGTYDSDGEYFNVNQKASAIDAVVKIETIYYSKLTTCDITGEIQGYPRNLILYLNRPFSLARLPMEKELARLFLDVANSEEAQRFNRQLIMNTAGDAADRMAYLELMFRVHSYKGAVNTSAQMLKAVVFAQIDYIRVYADFEKERLIYEKDMYEEDRRKRKKRSNVISGEDISLPEGPVFGEPVDTKKK